MESLHSLLADVPRFQNRSLAIDPLSGGITNQNYLLTCDGERFVLRLAGQNSELLGIDRQVEHDSAQAAFEAGIGPEIVAFLPQHHALVIRFLPGTVLSEHDLKSPALLAQTVDSLKRYHASPGGGGSFSGFETIRQYAALARQHQVQLPPEASLALTNLPELEARTGPPSTLVPCHNDLLASNLIQDQNKISIIDWEYAGVGDPFFDLANLASNNLFDRTQERLLLELYFGHVRTQDIDRLQLMRAVSDLREAFWAFLQLGISHLDFDYRAYGLRYLQRALAHKC